jgi:hypothetical protein
MKKIITLLMMLMLLQIAAIAQNTVHYEYDATGNRVKRWMLPPQPVAPAPPQNNNNPTVAEDINSLITADNLTPTLSKGEGESGSSSNGIVALTEGDIKVFPNPVQEKLNVQFKGTATPDGCSLQLFDGAGKLFYSEGSMQPLTEVNMQQAKAGIYYLVVVAKDGKRLYWKLVKQ